MPDTNVLLTQEQKIRELEAERDLYKQREERYRAILEGIEDGYYEVDLQGNTTFFNDSYLLLLGYSAQEMITMNYKDYVSKETAAMIFKTFNHVYRTAVPTKALDWPLIRKDGSICYVEISVSLMKDAHGKGIGFRGIMRDISKRKTVEEHLRKAMIKAEEANIAKNEFLANMSHEIRTPMNAVIGFCDILMDTPLTENQQDYTDCIRKNGEILLYLLSDILDFSKIESGEYDFETIDFDPELIIYDVFDLIRHKIGDKDIELLCRIDDNLPPLVNGDPTRLRQILTNLIDNAAKFTSQGEIELSLDLVAITNNKFDLHVKVRDSGIGIRPEQVKLIFEPFRQADGSTTRKYGGTGLGLSICKKLSQAMGGNIWAESTWGSGTTFNLALSFGKAREDHVQIPHFVSISGKNILIVDDNSTNLTILKYLLEKEGMRVTALDKSTDTLAVMEEATKKKDPFDLAIIDIQMPDMSGFQLASLIKLSKGPNSSVPLLALSSLMEKEASACHRSGFDGFLSKPVNRLKLYRMIEGLLSKGQVRKKKKDDSKDALLTQYSIRENLKHSIRILLAEDNPVNQKMATILLTKAGYHVDIAATGKEAVEKFTKAPSCFDVIFMDIQMPELDGLKATRMIREQGFHTIPIIAMTANAMKGDREKCLGAGMNDYIAKPIRREKVFEILEKWCFRLRVS